MPDVNPTELGTWSQIALGAGVFIGGLVYSIGKLLKPKKDDDYLLTNGENAKLVAQAKEIAELKALRREDIMRQEFDVKIQDVRQDFAEVMRSGREVFYNKLDEVKADVSEIKGILKTRLPEPRQR